MKAERRAASCSRPDRCSVAEVSITSSILSSSLVAAAAGGEREGRDEQQAGEDEEALEHGVPFERTDGTSRRQATSATGRRTAGARAQLARRRAVAGASPPSSSASRCSSSAIRSESALIASAIGSGRWIQSASGPCDPLALDPDRVAGVADHGRARRHVLDDDRVGADLGAVADRDRAEQLGAGADGDVVAEGRVALAALEAGAAQRHPLVEGHPLADLGGLADHHAGAVVDEELARRSSPPGGSRPR